MRKISVAALALLAAMSLGACSGMTTQDKDTAIGAAVGGAAGSLLGGGPVGTIGGAAVGGIIGHEVGKDKR